MVFRGVNALVILPMLLSSGAQAAIITELPDGVAQEMPAVNRLIGIGTGEVRFGVEGMASIRAVDAQRPPTTFFFGLNTPWGFGNPVEPSWTGSPAFATTGLYKGRLVISFDAPQAAVLGRFNWQLPGSFKAFSSSGKLLEILSLAEDAGRSPGFYGFRRSANEIARVELSGFNIGIRSIATLAEVSAVPEPATWAMMIGGFAAAGIARRRHLTAATVM